MIWMSWTWLGIQAPAVLARCHSEEENGAAGAVEFALADGLA